MIRLDKYLAEAGVGTRSQVKKAVRDGRVKINGETVKHADLKVDEETDIVTFDDEEVYFSEFVYFMLNAPVPSARYFTSLYLLLSLLLIRKYAT